MVSDSQSTPDERTILGQERDMFKRQFLKIQENYENKIKELSILKELGNTLRSADFYDQEAFFQGQVMAIRKYTTLEDITLMLLNDQLQVLEIVARGGSDRSIDNLAMPADNGAPGQALAQRSPVIIEDTPDDTTLLYVPVMNNDKAIGVLSLRHERTKGFDQNQVRFFSLVADQIATAVILLRFYHQMLREERQRLLLSRFFSKTVTEKIFGSGGNLRLGGERKNVTILFADLHGFTSMSEQLDQGKVVDILNAYFSLMTPVIFKHNGTLDKLMGDGILAFFGAPLSHQDDTLQSVRTAIEMMRVLKAFNTEIHEKNWPSLQVSIGINSGDVVAGYVGSEEHLNYTVIGDAVNVAQRLQSIAGPNEILITKTVRDEIRDNISETDGLKSFVRLPAQKVKGKERAIEVYRVET